MSDTDIKSDICRYAASLGFERCGVAEAEPLVKEEEYLKTWLTGGRAGSMAYMEREPARRSRPEAILPGAKSVIALAMTYDQPENGDQSSSERPKNNEGQVARYTNGKDYHKVIGKRLEAFVRYLQMISPESQYRTFVDTGPLLERAFAQRAGIGFIGKNTMLITRGLGSWVFLASVITTLDLRHDAPDDRSCGECRLCIDACPTEAITEPFHLDARRCIAYLTIENRGDIPVDLREKTGPWVFGCDICQEVCPHNGARQSSAIEIGLEGILSLRTEEDFRARFSGTALARAGREGLIRNACLAAAHLGREDLLPHLESLAREQSPLVQDAASWAIQKIRTTSYPMNESPQAPRVA